MMILGIVEFIAIHLHFRSIMCMTLLLSEPMTRAIVSGTCKLEWSNFTECVVNYVVTHTKMRFSGVISTAVLRYVEIRPETRMSVYIPQLCLGLLVMMVNGWLLVSLQGGTPQRRRPISRLVLSLTAAHCLHGAITVYIMTSLVASSLSANPLYRHQAVECMAANGFLITAILSALMHHVAIAIDRLHNIIKSVSYRMFWSTSRTLLLIGTIWTLSFIMAFLPVFGWRTSFSYCMFFYQYYKSYFFLLTILFFVCLLVVASLHSYIVLTTRSPTSATFHMKCSRNRQRQDNRLTTTVAILAVLSVIFWTPLLLYLVLACPQCIARSDNNFILLGVFALALTNALLSPLIYAFRVKQLRHFVSEIIQNCGLCKVTRRSGTFELRNNTQNGVRSSPMTPAAPNSQGTDHRHQPPQTDIGKCSSH